MAVDRYFFIVIFVASVLIGGFLIAWPLAFAVNRAMIRRGKGHAVVHQHHEH